MRVSLQNAVHNTSHPETTTSRIESGLFIHVIAKIDITKVLHRDFKLQSSKLWHNKNNLSAQFQIQLIGFKPNLSHFSFLKSLHKKHVFRIFLALSGGGHNRFYKKLYKYGLLQNTMHNTNYPKTKISRIESVFYNIVSKKNFEHGFLNLGKT